MIVRKEKMQVNHVFVDLHYDLDEASFESGSPVSSKPDHVIELYPDSFVGVTGCHTKRWDKWEPRQFFTL